MLTTYLKYAFRNILKQKSFSLLNIIGLSVSLSVTILILLWVQDEWNIDKFHAKSDSLYRVKRTIPLENNTFDVYEGIPYPVLKEGAEQVPGIESFIPLGRVSEESLTIENKDYRAEGTFATASLFSSLSFPVIAGNIEELDNKVNSITISENLAKSIYGSGWKTEALGKTMHIHNNGDFSIEAIFSNLPRNSSIQSEFFYSFLHTLATNEWMLDWGSSGMQGAFLLTDNANPNEVEKKLTTLFQENISGELKEACILQKFADDYLYGKFDENAVVSGGKIEYVRIFLIAAIFLLLISCINFINLATAVASKRGKEIGMRKIIGAGKSSLIAQFMLEAGMITFISVVVAVILAIISLPFANVLTGKVLDFSLGDPQLWVGLTGIFVIISLLAGAYPAFILSSFNPILAIQNKTKEKYGNINMRKVLVVSQFVISLLMIVGAITVRDQVHFIKNKNLGIQKDHIVSISQDAKFISKLEVLNTDLSNAPGIESVTSAGPSPLNMMASTSGVVWPDKRPDQENIEFNILWSSQNFTEVFEVPMAAGTYYRPEDKIDNNHIVLNETAIKLMGIEDPIGKTIQWWSNPREIIGVTKDFHNASLYDQIGPAGFILDAERANNIFIKIDPDQIEIALASIKNVFQKVVPDVPLHYNFLDEEYYQLYTSETVTGTIINYFAFVSIFISALGLLGLAIFMARLRNKEISIRKVLGSSNMGIIKLLSMDYIKLVVVAIALASPIGYYLMNKWLQNFTYRIELGWSVFFYAGFLALLIASLTIGFQSIKAAIIKPVKNLRAE